MVKGAASGLKRRGLRGALTVELLVAMTLLVLALIPLAYSILQERDLARSYYHRAILLELLDGELEFLAASQGNGILEGTQDYRIGGLAASNLPPGKFQLQRHGKRLRLEWRADRKRSVYSQEILLP